MRVLALMAAGLLLCGSVLAQTGPGGVGNKDGTSGQPQNVLWLRSDAGISSSGGVVDAWQDQSGNLNSASGTGATRPSLITSDANFNGLPSINFLAAPAATNYVLTVLDDDALDNTSALSVIYIIRPVNAATSQGILSKRVNSTTDISYFIYQTATSNRVGTQVVGNSTNSGTLVNNTVFINSSIVTGTVVAPFLNGTAQTTGTGPATIPNTSSNLYIGSFDVAAGQQSNFEGQIAEAIIFKSSINAAQRQIIENYLAAKYNVALAAGDVYGGDANTAALNFDSDVIGIGIQSGASHSDASAKGLVLAPANGTLDVNGEFLLAGHKTATNSVTAANVGAGVQQRWARTWHIDKTTAGTLDAFVSFDFSDGIGGNFPQNKDNYQLLRLNGATYDVVTIANADKSILGDRITFKVANADLIDGVYTLGTANNTTSPVAGVSNRTWYSYQSGNWTDPLSWTLDGGLFPLYVNTSAEVPGITDNVVVTSGRTIITNTNNLQINSIQVNGTLDVATSTGHNLLTITGDGTIRMAGNAGVDNFPAGTATDFADPSIGGKVEVYGSTISLNQARTFNKMTINMDAAATQATLMNNITLNGELRIDNGVLRFNDNASTTAKNLTVSGNVTVSSTAGIQVGTATARHQFNMYGNFNNDGGTVAFTNLASANTASEATNGIVDANFLSASQDQQVLCNGPTKFYRIKIAKGVDATYKATITASSVANFSLFGFADEDHGSVAQLANNNNALGLVTGTVELGTNVTIPVLSTASNYNVSAGAQLWVNGGTLNKDNGNAIVPYGKVRVSSGILTSRVNSGITTRDNGTIIVEGGTLLVNTIRTSVNGVGNVGGYIQSGGAVTIDGGGAGGATADYYVFSLTYTGNVFNMSGGTLTVKGARSGTAATRGAIFINSDPANVSVTGGTVVMEISNNNVYKVTSRVPFWNVIMQRTSGTATVVELNGGQSGETPGATEVTLTGQPLTVLNDLTINSPINFTTNNNNVTFGGSFEIKSGAAYTAGTNTTTVNGVGVSSITIGNTGASQVLNNFTVNRTTASALVRIVNGNATALRIDGSLRVERGILDYNTFTISAKGSVYNAGTIGASASTGKLLMDGAVAQTFTSVATASNYNLDINNTAGVSLAGDDMSILKALTLTNGVFNINIFKLTMSGAAAVITPLTFSNTRMIQTAGNTSDGGLQMFFDANENILFPIGTNANATVRYTPASVTTQTISGTGYIQISPSDMVLQTTNLSGSADILSYFWRVTPTLLGAATKTSYQFTYAQTDVTGTETNFLPGRVRSASPFTRTAEVATDINTTTNVLTFNGSDINSIFPGAGVAIEPADYTAGGASRFTGTPRVFYTRTYNADGWSIDWRTTSYWTFGTNGAFNVHDSRQVTAGDYPKAGDIAVIGYVPFTDPVTADRGKPHGIAVNQTETVAELRFTQMLGSTGNPTARVYASNFQFRPTVVINNNGGTPGSFSGGVVSGEGGFWIRSTGGNLSDPSWTGVDLGSFNAQDSSYMIYESTLANASYVNMPGAFPNLLMTTDNWGNEDKNSTINRSILVNGDLELLGDINLILPTGAVGDITILNNLRFFRSNAKGNDSGGGAEIRFGNTGTARTITVNGDWEMGNGYPFLVSIPSPGTTPLTHVINLYGSYLQNAPGTAGTVGFKGGTSSTQDRIHVNLLGSTSALINNTAGDAPQFYSLTIDKGTSIATTATFNSAFTLNGITNTPTKALTLVDGLMIINNAATNINLTTGGGDFNIPAAAGLEVRLGTVNVSGADNGILLDGLLLVSGGTVNMDGGAGINNYIEYSASGNATLTVTGGTLTVGSQIRRNLTNTAGILRYSQSGGTVVIAKRVAPSIIRGVFEVVNTGSSFSHTGGSFTIVQGVNSTTVPSLLLEPATSNVGSGTTIVIGNTDTPSGANSQNIGIKATVAINNLTIAGSNNPIAKIYIAPLTLNGTLLINTNTKFNANGQGLNIGVNMQVDGAFIASGNLTTFTGTGAISGATPSLEFYNLTKNGTGTLTQSRNVNVDKDLIIQSGGTIAGQTFTLALRGNADITGNHTSTSGAAVVGLHFTGTAQQILKRSAAGTSQLGVVTTNNSAGVIIPDGNNYNFTINNGLRMSQGVFDIGGSLLTLTLNAFITPVNAFSVTNMIQTNSSFTDKGVKKIFPTGYTTDFTYPVGQLVYSPVRFNFATGTNTTGGSGTPTITVRPANEKHPSIIEDAESPSPEIVDANNVLQYHWIINADNVAATFKSDMILSYVQSLVAVTAPYTEADYIAARILSDANPSNAIDKFNVTDVNEVANTITFSFSGLTDAGMSGDYFAGIDTAIPDNIRTFITTRAGNVTEGTFPAGVYDNAVPGGGAPRGAVLVVENGHTLTFNTNDVSLYKTEIKAGGTLIIPTGSIGHRLGTLTGEGTLRIESNTASAVLPAAVYDDFFSCAGGTLTYAGTGTYEVLGAITTVRNLVLDGSNGNTQSIKTMANNDIFICEDFIVEAGGFKNDVNNRSITIGDDLIIDQSNSTGFRTGTGNITTGGDFQQNLGVFLGSTGGTKTINGNFILAGGTFTAGSGGSFNLRGDMNFSGGTFGGGTSTLKFVFDGTSTQVITGDFTSSSRFQRFEIANTNNVSLNGNVDIFQEIIFTNGRIVPNANLLTLSTAAVATPTEGRVNSYVNGRLYKQMTAGSTFIFPIGSSSLWRYGSVNSPSGGVRTWYMEYFYAPPTSNPLVDNLTPCSSTILRISAGEFWKVGDDGASGLSARIGLSWGIESDVSATLSEREALQVMVWNDGSSCWNERGGTSFSAAHTQNRGSFISSSAIAFSEQIVTLGSSEVANPLPVTWVYFKGSTSGSMNLLTWKTESEINSSHFELLHSTDGETFTRIATLAGQGNTTQETIYNFTHRDPAFGYNYYRLKQVDFNGAFEFYPEVLVLENTATETGLAFMMYPNPTKSKEVSVVISKSNTYPVKVRVMDVTGKVVYEDLVAGELLTNEYKVKFGQTVSQGIYLVEISQGGRRLVKRLVVD